MMNSELDLLGSIIRLQLQYEPLVRGVRPNRTYSLEPLHEFDTVTLSRLGVIAKRDGGWVLDRHHAAHPASLAPSLERLLSIGFTSHYDKMREHFGWAPIGVGGENIIVETDAVLSPEDAQRGFVIGRQAGDVELNGAAVAEPCAPFTRLLLQDPTASIEDLKAHRDYLRGGMRGFVTGLGNFDNAVAIEVGDLVYLRN